MSTDWMGADMADTFRRTPIATSYWPSGQPALPGPGIRQVAKILNRRRGCD